MTWLESLLERVSTALVYLAMLAVLTLTAFVCLSAIMRYFVGSPFHFTEELVALLFLSTVFLTLPYATLHGQHIRVILFTGWLKGRLGMAAAFFNLIVIFVFAVWFTLESVSFTRFAYDIDAISEQSGITLWPWMAMMPVTLGLVAVIVVMQIIKAMMTGRSQSDESSEHG